MVISVDSDSKLAAVEAVVTTDLRLASHFNDKQAVIEDRFARMASNLSDPYSTLQLPSVMTAAEVLELA